MKLKHDILYDKSIIYKLTDYVLLNSCSVNSSGLYNGKAGIALALFEVARCLQDKYLEERACELLQESLLSKNEDIGFENGLSGIGYVLYYLVENKFVDADFEELFGDKLNKIKSTLDGWKEAHISTKIFNNLKIVYFLDQVSRYNEDKAVIFYIKLFSATAEDGLIKQFKEKSRLFSTSHSTIDILEAFREYLKIACNCHSFQISSAVFYHYVNLYQSNRCSSDFLIGHYLHTMVQNTEYDEINTIAKTNIEYAVKNIYPEAMSLQQRLDQLYLLFTFYLDKYPKQVELLDKGLFDIREKSIQEQSLCMGIPTACLKAGYQSGVARLLLYWAYRINVVYQTNCTRFNKIF